MGTVKAPPTRTAAEEDTDATGAAATAEEDKATDRGFDSKENQALPEPPAQAPAPSQPLRRHSGQGDRQEWLHFVCVCRHLASLEASCARPDQA